MKEQLEQLLAERTQEGSARRKRRRDTLYRRAPQEEIYVDDNDEDNEREEGQEDNAQNVQTGFRVSFNSQRRISVREPIVEARGERTRGPSTPISQPLRAPSATTPRVTMRNGGMEGATITLPQSTPRRMVLRAVTDPPPPRSSDTMQRTPIATPRATRTLDERVTK